MCGTRYPILTNPIIPVPSGGLSTVSYDVPIGGTFQGVANSIMEKKPGVTKVLDVHDLVCPTWGVQGQRSGSFKVGPPYFPIIIPPKELFSFQPEWAKCTKFDSDSEWLLTFGIFDPPYKLTPQGQMSQTTPPPVPAGVVSPTPVADPPTTLHPGNVWSPATPKATLDPLFNPSEASPVNASPSPAADPGHTPAADPEARPTTAPGQPPAPNPGQNPPTDPKQQPPAKPEPSRQPGSNSGPASPIETPTTPEGPQKPPSSGSSSPGLGWIIFSAFGGSSKTSPNQNDPSQPSTVSDRLFSLNPAVQPTPGAITPAANIPVATPIFTVAGQTFKADPSALAIGGTTIRPDGPGIVVAGTPISLGPSGTLYIGGTPTRIAPPDPLSPQIFTVGGQIVSAVPSALAIGGTTIRPGDPGITISGTPVSLAPSGTLFVGGVPTQLTTPGPAPPQVYIVGGQTITADPSGVAVGDTTIHPGDAGITLAGTAVSLGPSGTLYVGGVPTKLPSVDPTTPQIFTVGGQTFTAAPTGLTVSGITLHPGDPALIISGTPVSLATSGTLYINNVPTPLLSPNPSPQIFTIGGQTVTASPTGLTFGGTTLHPGDPAITLSGTPISLGPSGTLFINGIPTVLPPAPSSSSPPPAETFLINGQAVTVDATDIVVAGSTLFPGSAPVTVGGQAISLAAPGVLVVGSATIGLSHPTITTVGGQKVTIGPEVVAVNGTPVLAGGQGVTVGGVLVSLVGNGVTVTGTGGGARGTGIGNATVQLFRGGGERGRGREWRGWWIGVGGAVVMYIM